MADRQALTRERLASAAQYGLLGGFASVAAGISAQGLTGFARSNMGLRGPWPYLLFLALDGAAGVCAVLLARRAARDDGGLAPRLAVWGLVSASAFFNFTHAPRRPAAPEAYALMPVVAAVLFEFCLREMRMRRTGRADRKLAGLRWLYPAERVRVQKYLAADEQASAGQATRHVRVEQAARRLYQLRIALLDCDRAARPGRAARARARRARRRAQAALIRARFTDQDIAADVLRQVQVLTQTEVLARLDYASPHAAHAALASLITAPAAPGPPPGTAQAEAEPASPDLTEPPGRGSAARISGRTAGGTAAGRGEPALEPAGSAWAEAGDAALTRQPPAPRDEAGNGDPDQARLIDAATRIVASAESDGTQLTQVALAEKLRAQGYSFPNNRLRWLSDISGVAPRQGRPPDQRAAASVRTGRPAAAHPAPGDS